MKFLLFQMFPPRQTGACWRVGQQRRNISTTAAPDNKLPSSSIIKWRPGKPGHISVVLTILGIISMIKCGNVKKLFDHAQEFTQLAYICDV